MIVTFISQCQKKALKRTRTILDSFARRIGDKTWQTVITNEGLIEVKSLLKQSASKNTAVSCHYSSGYKKSKLLWIIGNRKAFDNQGVIPIATTTTSIINTELENNWYYLPLIKSLTAMASLFHDWGKASKFFQLKLKKKKGSDPLRHEWVSCLLLSAFCNQYDNDEAWLDAIIDGILDDSQLKIKDIKYLEQGAQKDTAHILTWLILSHHRLAYSKVLKNQCYDFNSISDFFKNVTKEWGYAEGNRDKIDQCLELKSYLRNSDLWLKEIKKWSKRLRDNIPLLKESISNGSYRLLLLYSRMSMMLGDHLYSSQDADSKGDKKDKIILYANTDKNGELKQPLDEHLVGVSKKSLEISHLLPTFENGFAYCSDINSLCKKSKDEKFKWQDRAVSTIAPFAKEKQGFFIVNMASTGCGKTLANAKIMNALSLNKLRYTLALGLRSLTLQTGDEYREKINLDKTELAVIIGSSAHLELHDHNKDANSNGNRSTLENIGSESMDELSEDYFINGDIVNFSEAHFKTIIKNKKHGQFLYTPIVVCTIDHIIAASEVVRGGKYILPTIRLMSADLVIDEIDDFDQENSLIAIGRLVHLAGMLGRRVMISSATIPPAIAEGYFNVYQEGWKIFSHSRLMSNEVHCAWVDEFNTSVEIIKENFIESYKKYHEKFIAHRVEKLRDQKLTPIKRKGKIVEVEMEEKKYFDTIQQTIIEQHHYHSKPDQDNKKVSFGAVRMAQVESCIGLAKHLIKSQWPENIDVKVMAYHSKQVLLLRNRQERHLDTILKRHKQGENVFQGEFETIKQHTRNSSKKNIVFILVATPIEEVGRDHDFDFAIIEPSSMRSIIQLAGRVMRHRSEEPEHPNISIMQYPYPRHGQQEILYSKPGYESIKNRLNTHDIKELLQGSAIEHSITSIPRIQKPKKILKSGESLIVLEHKVLSDCLTNYEEIGIGKMQGWVSTFIWMTAASQKLAKFRESETREAYYLMPKEDSWEGFVFKQRNAQGNYVSTDNKIKFFEADMEEDRLWLVRNYGEILSEIAEQKELTEKEAAFRFGLLEVREKGGESYNYSQHFGLMKRD